jgi:peptidoglycan/LPS O-acetylase OafA/YrhL
MAKVVAALGAAGLCWNMAWPSGWITGMFIEYWAHFCLGALLFHVLCVSGSRLVGWSMLGGAAVLDVYCLLHILPWRPQTLLHERVFLELAVASSFALALYAARPFSVAVSGWQIWRPVAALGTISYSLYLVNQFNLTLVESTVERLAPAVWRPFQVALMLAIQIAIAAAFWYRCERPFLNAGSDRLPRQRPARELPEAHQA